MQKALGEKINKHLKFDDEGLEMWKIHMDNKKQKEVIHDVEGVDKHWNEFVAKHKKVQAHI